MARRLHRSERCRPRAAPTTRCAKRRSRCATAKLPGPTAVITHGANPGLVSHFVKQALLDLAADAGVDAGRPARARRVGQPGEQLGVKVIHIAERDTQVATVPKEPGEFVNTWSVDGFVSEGSQPAELGWGTHEKHFPRDGKRHDFGRGSAIYLMRPGAGTRVRSWTPLAGHFHGFLITHGESISIADYLTLAQGRRGALPADRALRLSPVRRRGAVPARARRQELALAGSQAAHDGRDHDGHRRARRAAGGAREECVLVRLAADDRGSTAAGAAQQRDLAAGDGRGARRAWSGRSRTRTTASSSPRRWISRASSRYRGPISATWSASTATGTRSSIAAGCFAEDLDETDPWQFKNVRVI